MKTGMELAEVLLDYLEEHLEELTDVRRHLITRMHEMEPRTKASRAGGWLRSGAGALLIHDGRAWPVIVWSVDIAGVRVRPPGAALPELEVRVEDLVPRDQRGDLPLGDWSTWPDGA